MKIRKIGDRKWKVVLFQGSPRDKESCPNMESKTSVVVEHIIQKWSPFINFKVIDLSVNGGDKPIIQPCKGCVSTAGGYHCVAEGERVETKYGYKKIEDIKIGDELSTGIVYDFKKTGENTTVYEITISDGRKIKLTDNHPIKVIKPIYKNGNKRKLNGYDEKWIDVKNLELGDRIPFRFTGQFFEDDSNLNNYLLCGLIWGDGSVHHKKMKLCYDVRDKLLIDKISNIFDISISKYSEVSKNTSVKWIKFNDDKVNNFINDLIFEEKSKNIHDRRIPDSIMNSSKSQIANFLNGWFASDGSIIKRNLKNKYYEINLTSVSKDSLRDCQLLLSKFGIKSSITYLDHIETFRFNKLIKRSSMLVISGKNCNIFMDEIGIFNKDFKFEKLKYRNSKNYDYFGKIEKIEEKYKTNVYDISVTDSHKFICEGIEIHNCHFPCSCFGKGMKQPDLLSELNVYELLKECDAFLIFSPIHWHSLSSQVKTLFDRLVSVNQTLSVDDAKKLMGDGNIKNGKITGKFSKSGKHNNLLRNHLEGKVAGFWAQGDDGANDYNGKELPPSYSDVLDDGFTNNAKNVLMPFVMQLKYSGVFVPDELIEAFYTNRGLDYYSANKTKNSEFMDRANNLIENLLDYLEKNNNSDDKEI